MEKSGDAGGVISARSDSPDELIIRRTRNVPTRGGAPALLVCPALRRDPQATRLRAIITVLEQRPHRRSDFDSLMAPGAHPCSVSRLTKHASRIASRSRSCGRRTHVIA